MVKFDVGDEVECVEACVKVRKGMTGKVVKTNAGHPPVLVAWDNFEGKGHTGAGTLPDTNGYWVYPKNITHAKFNLINE